MASLRLHVLGLALTLLLATKASAVSIDWVTVGNAGNAADTTIKGNDGSVGYGYRIGKYEVTAGQYTEFLNAVAGADTYGLYSENMDVTNHVYGCNIVRSGASGSYTYSVAADWADRPVNYVSWGDAARFANWLHNGQPSGAQDLTTTEDGAYYLNGATTEAALLAVTRHSGARIFVPSEDEWYKAAYHKNDGVTGNYFLFPTSGDSVPSNALVTPDPGNNANFWDGDVTTIGPPYYRTLVGEFEDSDSPYGTFDQGGNSIEWTDTITWSYRVVRGGYWGAGVDALRSTYAMHGGVSGEDFAVGFRVASQSEMIPEPETAMVCMLGVLALWIRERACDSSGS